MTYNEAMKYLQNVEYRGAVLGLDNMKVLCEKLGNPQNECQFIHIGGTNGKGSVSTFISSILSEAGFRVGRYISPVVFLKEEMIQIQSKEMTEFISKEEFVDGICKIYEIEKQLTESSNQFPTLFEVETALAFYTFANRKCDIVVLEVGLGGREDATNIIKSSLATVITPISMDHMNILGHTIEKIAWEKAGIIKEDGIVISSEQQKDVISVLESVCYEKKSKFIKMNSKKINILTSSLDGTTFFYDFIKYRITMLGEHQVENAVQAILTVQHLTGMQVSKEAIFCGLANARWPGRFEIVNKMPLTIIDGAHNVAGARALKNALEYYLKDRKIIGIMGVFADKDVEGICKEVLPVIDSVIIVPAIGERSFSTDKLFLIAKKYNNNVKSEKSVTAAYEQCLDKVSEQEAIVVFGTLSFLSEITRKCL